MVGMAAASKRTRTDKEILEKVERVSAVVAAKDSFKEARFEKELRKAFGKDAENVPRGALGYHAAAISALNRTRDTLPQQEFLDRVSNDYLDGLKARARSVPPSIIDFVKRGLAKLGWRREQDSSGS